MELRRGRWTVLKKRKMDSLEEKKGGQSWRKEKWTVLKKRKVFSLEEKKGGQTWSKERRTGLIWSHHSLLCCQIKKIMMRKIWALALSLICFSGIEQVKENIFSKGPLMAWNRITFFFTLWSPYFRHLLTDCFSVVSLSLCLLFILFSCYLDMLILLMKFYFSALRFLFPVYTKCVGNKNHVKICLYWVLLWTYTLKICDIR